MSKTYQIKAASGSYILPHASNSMDRTISYRFHKKPNTGTVEIKARPFGRTDFLPIEGAPPFPSNEEKTITCAFPVAELMVILDTVTGGSLAYITVADSE